MTELEVLTQINATMDSLLLYHIALSDMLSLTCGFITAGIFGLGFKA